MTAGATPAKVTRFSRTYEGDRHFGSAAGTPKKAATSRSSAGSTANTIPVTIPRTTRTMKVARVTDLRSANRRITTNQIPVENTRYRFYPRNRVPAYLFSTFFSHSSPAIYRRAPRSIGRHINRHISLQAGRPFDFATSPVCAPTRGAAHSLPSARSSRWIISVRPPMPITSMISADGRPFSFSASAAS